MKIEVSHFIFQVSPSCDCLQLYTSGISEDGENTGFIYFDLKFDKKQNKTCGVIIRIDIGVITRAVVLSFIAE